MFTRASHALLLGAVIAIGLGLGAAGLALAADPASPCGDGLLARDETCDSCPADCQASTCETKGRRTVTVDLTPQSGYDKVGATTILLGYRRGVLSLPAEGSAPAVSARVKARQAKAQAFVNDLGYALRVVVSSQEGLPAGPLLDIELDTCAGAPAARDDDLSCRVESCAQGGGKLRACECRAHLP